MTELKTHMNRPLEETSVSFPWPTWLVVALLIGVAITLATVTVTQPAVPATAPQAAASNIVDEGAVEEARLEAMEAFAPYAPYRESIALEEARTEAMEAFAPYAPYVGDLGVAGDVATISVEQQRLAAIEECCGHFGLSQREVQELAGASTAEIVYQERLKALEECCGHFGLSQQYIEEVASGGSTITAEARAMQAWTARLNGLAGIEADRQSANEAWSARLNGLAGIEDEHQKDQESRRARLDGWLGLYD